MLKFLKWAVLCSMLVFSNPLSAREQDVKMAIRVEKTITKLSKAHEKPPEKMAEYCKEIRREIEKKFGYRFYVKEYLEWAIELIENDCGKVFLKEDKAYLTKVFKVKPDSGYEDIFKLNFDENDKVLPKAAMVEGVKKLDNKVVLGVSMVLSGLYLSSTRAPIYVFWGERMVSKGIDVCKAVFLVAEEQKAL